MVWNYSRRWNRLRSVIMPHSFQLYFIRMYFRVILSTENAVAVKQINFVSDRPCDTVSLAHLSIKGIAVSFKFPFDTVTFEGSNGFWFRMHCCGPGIQTWALKIWLFSIWKYQYSSGPSLGSIVLQPILIVVDLYLLNHCNLIHKPFD